MSFDRGPAGSLTVRVREMWEFLAGTSAGFGAAVSVAVAPESRLCSPGWVGIVVIEGATLATAPDQETACLTEQALGGLAADAVTSAGVLPAPASSRLPIAEIRGPATLAYLDPADFRPQPAVTTPLDLDHPDLQAFLQAAEAADLEESGMAEITTPAFAVRQHGQVVAAAGYRDWPGGTAHLSVLTAASARGHASGPAGRVPGRRARDRRGQAAAVAGATRGLPARGPHAGIPRTRRAGEPPARRGGPRITWPVVDPTRQAAVGADEGGRPVLGHQRPSAAIVTGCAS